MWLLSQQYTQITLNYKYVLEDRSLGVHNAAYAIQILYDTIESLDPGFDTSNRP
ncbi:hypothetical protein ES705_20601 [subsurface metagenome]